MFNSEFKQRIMNLSPAFLVDARSRLKLTESHLDSGIRPVVPFTSMIGTAVTVELELAKDEGMADLTLLVEAYEAQDKPGSIMVIQIPLSLHEYGIFGEGAASLAQKGGFVGVLVEGAVRDTVDLRRLEFPAFSRTIAPGYIMGKVRVASIGKAVRIGGRVIKQADVIVADNDGVMVIPPDELEDVVTRAEAIKEWEHRVHQLFLDGVSSRDIRRLAGAMP